LNQADRGWPRVRIAFIPSLLTSDATNLLVGVVSDIEAIAYKPSV
jgi:hypothetical protein